MRNSHLLKVVAVLFGLTLLASACGGDDAVQEKLDEATTTAPSEGGSGESGGEDEGEAAATETTAAAEDDGENVVELAAGNPQLKTLVSLVQEAGLAETLSGPGPFTIMAPTDDAFAALPAGALSQLQADRTGALADLLKLHVIPASYDAKAIAKAADTCVTTLGGKVKITEVAEGDYAFGGKAITQTDLDGSNGVIHVIDGVVTTPSTDC